MSVACSSLDCPAPAERVIRFHLGPYSLIPYCDEHTELVLQGFSQASEEDDSRALRLFWQRRNRAT